MRTVEPPKVVQNAGVLYILTCKCASRHSGVQFFHIATWKSGPNPSVFWTFWLQNVFLATAACNFSTSQLEKAVRTRQFFNILTSKCISRYSGVQFFHIATSKSGPNLSVFQHFDFKMYFSLQRRAILPHRNFKKRSEPVSVLTFWLQNVLLATTVCNFPTSQLQKVVRACSVLYILTSKCASRYSGVLFFMSSLNSYLRTRRFSEVTFRPSRHRKHWKTQHFATSLTFRACGSSFFPHLLIFFLAALLFQLFILSEVRLLNFLRWKVWHGYGLEQAKVTVWVSKMFGSFTSVMNDINSLEGWCLLTTMMNMLTECVCLSLMSHHRPSQLDNRYFNSFTYY